MYQKAGKNEFDPNDAIFELLQDLDHYWLSSNWHTDINTIIETNNNIFKKTFYVENVVWLEWKFKYFHLKAVVWNGHLLNADHFIYMSMS